MFKTKAAFSTRHVCKLDDADLTRELPRLSPFSPLFTKFLYKFRKWTIAARWHPSSKLFFRSSCALYKERKRQLKSHKNKWIIHPLSKLATLRQMIMCLLWTVAFITDPVVSAYRTGYLNKHRSSFQESFRMALNTLFFLDIVFQMFLGFTLDKTKEIVLDQPKIISNYLRSWFLIDVIPVVFYFLYFQFRDFWFGILMLIPQVYCLRFFRLCTMLTFFSNTLEFFRVRESFIRCYKLFLVTLITIHWCTCLLYIVPVISYYLGSPLQDSWVLQGVLGTQRTVRNRYVECLLSTVCHFVGAGKGNIETENPTEQLILACILICGFGSHIYIIAVIIQLFGTINISETKYEDLIYQLNEYMMTKKLPQPLRKRLLTYYEYRFQKQFFMENLILTSLSEHLRYEVLLYSCRTLINKLRMFQGAPKNVIGTMVSMLKHEIFLADDVIIKPEPLNENVYFISFGTVSEFKSDGRELLHLEDGQNFGEVHIVLQNFAEQQSTTVRAIETTEVFYLRKHDIWYIMDTHPEIADALEKSATAKMVIYQEKMTESYEHIHDVNVKSIMKELRKGRILLRCRKRI